MHYHAYELTHALLAPWRFGVEAVRAGLEHPLNPLAPTPAARGLAAVCELFDRTTRRYGKPRFGIDTIERNGRIYPVEKETVCSKPFCTLIRFSVGHAARNRYKPRPQILLVAPMSGHYATLLRRTITTLLEHHDVIVTDWADARDVPVIVGPFGLADFIDYLIEFLQVAGPQTHVVAVSQSSVPALAATALLASDEDPCTPASLTLLGGPVDARINPTPVNRLVENRSLSWFEGHVLSLVPFPHAGATRRVYPGFMQLTGFMTMDLNRHWHAQAGLFHDLVRGDADSARQHQEFYEDYLAVMDLTAEFFLDTIETVFHRHALPNGEFEHRGQRVDLSAIRDTALFTVEAGRDVVCGKGQTHAAQKLCTALPAHLRVQHDEPDVGHFGLFNGTRWRTKIAPRIADVIRSVEDEETQSNVVPLPTAR